MRTRYRYKTISEKIDELNRNFEQLVRAHYQLMKMLIPEVSPTKKEIRMIKERKKEETISFEELKRRFKKR